jgi:hypothetical protein
MLVTIFRKKENSVLHSKSYGFKNQQLVKLPHYLPAISHGQIIECELQDLVDLINNDGGVVFVMGTPNGIESGAVTFLSRAAFAHYFPAIVEPPFIGVLNGQTGSTRTLDTMTKNTVKHPKR